MAYKKDYIKQVILRIDYKTDSEEEKVLTPELRTVASRIGNIHSIQNSVNIEFKQIGDTNTYEKKDTNNVVWVFSDAENKKKASISSRFFFIEESRYDGFEKLKEEFCSVVSCLPSNALVINRIGLRYIDEIDIENNNCSPINNKTFWCKYINASLIANLDFFDDENIISRVLSQFDMNFDPIKLRFKFGLFNPDFPAVNKKSIFGIDTDVYVQGDISIADVPSYIMELHEKASLFFEKAITDGLRELMNNE